MILNDLEKVHQGHQEKWNETFSENIHYKLSIHVWFKDALQKIRHTELDYIVEGLDDKYIVFITNIFIKRHCK